MHVRAANDLAILPRVLPSGTQRGIFAGTAECDNFQTPGRGQLAHLISTNLRQLLNSSREPSIRHFLQRALLFFGDDPLCWTLAIERHTMLDIALPQVLALHAATIIGSILTRCTSSCLTQPRQFPIVFLLWGVFAKARPQPHRKHHTQCGRNVIVAEEARRRGA